MPKYRQWECQNCGWIYDEAKGWPEDGIAPGTRWEDIPEDWCCPQCGASKQDFSMRELGTPEGGAASPETCPSSPSPSHKSTITFRIWECMVCGWVYDEAQGCPEEGIAPGTRWEDIPEDWCCPQCGVGKEDFDMVLVSSAPEQIKSDKEPSRHKASTALTENRGPLVIIGTGLAGYNLALEFRKHDRTSPLMLISSDDGTFYSKPLLSASLSHGKTASQLCQASAEEMARRLNAQILVHTHVISISPHSRALTLRQEAGGHTANMHYDRLVLATGAQCRKLPAIAGDAHARLFRINNLTDYHRFRTALVGCQRVLLMGAGLIGCEFANDLVQAGFNVTVVDPQDWPLASLLPEAAGRDLQGVLSDNGVRFNLGRSIRSLSHSTNGIEAKLDNGKILEADIALAALGLEADTTLAKTAGLKTQRGITVDRSLQTSDPYIFAIGDCAELEGHQLFYVAPLMTCARALALTLSGEPCPVCYGVIPVAVKTTLRPTTVCPPQLGAEGSWQISSDNDGVCAEFRNHHGELLGFALIGAAIAERERLASECAPLMNDKSFE
ncbi:FAD-dependent oxidoreductase [Microbulbifer sp. THAF38]|uniref:FAD-dependent oxidoreductase n=1 Tax=Microbulbifer sp. THAF38 TaxID=2587856 RepID=UPI0012680A70|nr:FAD-dependent oxidoreductase [Microbulbifer sp. THAF38]QFT56131.1 Rubredoxin-NAD(+) reductase [Microbulbifer sp. THAF38]